MVAALITAAWVGCYVSGELLFMATFLAGMSAPCLSICAPAYRRCVAASTAKAAGVYAALSKLCVAGGCSLGGGSGGAEGKKD